MFKLLPIAVRLSSNKGCLKRIRHFCEHSVDGCTCRPRDRIQPWAHSIPMVSLVNSERVGSATSTLGSRQCQYRHRRCVTGPVNLHNEVVNGKVRLPRQPGSGGVGGARLRAHNPFRQEEPPSPASVNSNVAQWRWASAINTALWLFHRRMAQSQDRAPQLRSPAPPISTRVRISLTAPAPASLPHRASASGMAMAVTINGAAIGLCGDRDITGNSGNKLDGALTLTGRHYLPTMC